MKRITAFLLTLCILFTLLPNIRAGAAVSVFEHSDTYRKSKYYENLLNVEFTDDIGANVAAVALSQVGYHEGKSSGDLSGSSSGKGNHTEYGVNFGLPGDPWCAVFVWWCARQAGVEESIYRKTEWAKMDLQPFDCVPLSRCDSILPGDIVFVDSSHGDGIEEHVGIVTKATDKEITVVEGNSSNAVRKRTYSRSSGLRDDKSATLTYVGRPDYYGYNSSVASYETVFVSSPDAVTYSGIGGVKNGRLKDGEYMLLSVHSSGDWLQIVAPNGIDSLFIPAENAEFSVKNLPPITGYDAWSTFEPQNFTTTVTTVPTQTDPPVTTTTVTTTVPVPVTEPTSTAPSSVEISGDPDNGYTSSFGNDWITYAAYGLLGILAIAFVIILISLMGGGRKNDDDGYDGYR